MPGSKYLWKNLWTEDSGDGGTWFSKLVTVEGSSHSSLLYTNVVSHLIARPQYFKMPPGGQLMLWSWKGVTFRLSSACHALKYIKLLRVSHFWSLGVSGSSHTFGLSSEYSQYDSSSLPWAVPPQTSGWKLRAPWTGGSPLETLYRWAQVLRET